MIELVIIRNSLLNIKENKTTHNFVLLPAGGKWKIAREEQ